MKRLVKQELLFWVDTFPDDLSTPHMETWPVMRINGRMRMRIYRQTYMRQIIIQILYNEPNGISPSYLIKMRTANLNDAQLWKSTGY